MATASRATLSAGLVTDQWVQVFRLEDYEGDPSYQCHALNLEFDADVANAAPVRIILDVSDDGSTWTRFYTHTIDLVPGGHTEFPAYHTKPYVRCLAFSRGSGLLVGQANVAELQTLPQFIPAERGDLTSRTWCAHDCQTAQTETSIGTMPASS